MTNSTPIATAACNGKASATSTAKASQLDLVIGRIKGGNVASTLQENMDRLTKIEENSTLLKAEIEKLKAAGLQKDLDLESLRLSHKALEGHVNNLNDTTTKQDRIIALDRIHNTFEEQIKDNNVRIEEVASRDRLGNYWTSYENRVGQLEFDGKNLGTRVTRFEDRLNEQDNQQNIKRAGSRLRIRRIEERLEVHRNHFASIGAVIKIPEMEDNAPLSPTPQPTPTRRRRIVVPGRSSSVALTPLRNGDSSSDLFTSEAASPVPQSLVIAMPLPSHERSSRTNSHPHNALTAQVMRDLTSSVPSPQKRHTSPTEIGPIAKKPASSSNVNAAGAKKPSLSVQTQNLPGERQSKPATASSAVLAKPSQPNSAFPFTMFNAAQPKIRRISHSTVIANSLVPTPASATSRPQSSLGSVLSSKTANSASAKSSSTVTGKTTKPPSAPAKNPSSSSLNRNTTAPASAPIGPRKNNNSKATGPNSLSLSKNNTSQPPRPASSSGAKNKLSQQTSSTSINQAVSSTSKNGAQTSQSTLTRGAATSTGGNGLSTPKSAPKLSVRQYMKNSGPRMDGWMDG